MVPNPNSHSFFEHLDELKSCLVRSAVAILVVSFIVYYGIDHVMRFIIKPVRQVVFTAPADAFVAEVHLSLFCGFIVSLPYVLFEVWKFVSSGLHPNERKYVTLYGPLSLVSFLIGGLFAYFVVLPIAMQFLLGFSSEYMVPMITVDKYIAFVGSIILAFGTIFELPLVLLFLTSIGVATPAFLIQKRRHAIVIILVVSAFLTPPDIMTLFLMSIPLILLYEIGVVVSRLTYREKNHAS